MYRLHYCLIFFITATLLLYRGNLISLVDADPLDLPDIPLEISTFVSPNIAFLIDNSGSMNNIVPESPYDASATYFTCPLSITLAAGDTVNLWVSSIGNPYFEYDDTDYDWGTVDASGVNSFPQRCFDPTQNYKAKLGEPRKAGHFIASMTYRHDQLPFTREGQLFDLG